MANTTAACLHVCSSWKTCMAILVILNYVAIDSYVYIQLQLQYNSNKVSHERHPYSQLLWLTGWLGTVVNMAVRNCSQLTIYSYIMHVNYPVLEEHGLILSNYISIYIAIHIAMQLRSQLCASKVQIQLAIANLLSCPCMEVDALLKQAIAMPFYNWLSGPFQNRFNSSYSQLFTN